MERFIMDTTFMGLNTTTAVCFFALIVLSLWLSQTFKSRTTTSRHEGRLANNDNTSVMTAYTDIEPLIDFDLSTAPVPFIPIFKPKYHITMALENVGISDILAMDRTYVERLQVRRKIFEEYADTTIQSSPEASPAVFELYEWLMGTYLPKRYPSVYRIVNADAHLDEQSVLNIATGEHIPMRPSSAQAALRILGDHVDTDFNVLLPSSHAPDELPIYHLWAFVLAFPSGFDISKKLGQPLSGVHKNVPGYKARLERSMDKTFAKLEVGKVVKRSNWTITTDQKLFNLGGTHFHADEKKQSAPSVASAQDSAETWDAEIERQRAEVVVDNCRLRSERQVLFRLPKTKALVFAFKTYTYKLEDVKAEGRGPALAEAIEGLSLGNVPEFQFYKRGVVWGPKVIEYLRS